MKEYSILIGGKAGFGIDKAGSIIAGILNKSGYRIYVYREYPSLIRGGHTFSIVRASNQEVTAHRDNVDFILALNQDSVNFHQARIKDKSRIIYDSDSVKSVGTGIPLGKIIQEERAPEIMRNSCIIGSFCRAAGIEWDILTETFSKNISKELELNLKVARRGYNAAQEITKIERLSNNFMPLVTGNEAIGMGLIKAGLKAYIAYPMTPSSGILHFMAEKAQEYSLKVIHPESEISVMLMSLGFAYVGERIALGTSGGGFCLMTEGLSFSGMAELPIVAVVGQRPGPSTGLPTYTSQTELHFVLHAGQGEFPRFIVAPGDAEEAYYWSAVSLNLAWKYQIPAIILSDKTLAEGAYSFNKDAAGEIKEEVLPLWDKSQPYKRYTNTQTGVSPLTFVPEKDAVIKVNSYEHDEFGITTEDPAITKVMQEKRLRKEKFLSKELQAYKAVNIYGDVNSSTALLCWGSNKGACIETAMKFGLKVIHVQVIWPLPIKRLQDSLTGVTKLISVENNATSQLVGLISAYGFKVDKMILKYDGRPFSVEVLEEEVRKTIQ
ncbi:MAG: 2-oxoacid:acceptor oxidoreductase subunit alpha [Candidatus Omnitrophota bacterium]|jgi:2-oxoglutarate ferredoxin oxidoreductase subunit alpha